MDSILNPIKFLIRNHSVNYKNQNEFQALFDLQNQRSICICNSYHFAHEIKIIYIWRNIVSLYFFHPTIRYDGKVSCTKNNESFPLCYIILFLRQNVPSLRSINVGSHVVAGCSFIHLFHEDQQDLPPQNFFPSICIRPFYNLKNFIGDRFVEF